jgi:sulfite oxidase
VSSCINRNYTQYDRQTKNDFKTLKTSALTAAGLGLAAAAGFWFYIQNDHPNVLALEKSQDQSIEEFGCFIEGLPVYTIEDIANHSDEKSGIWVSYRNGVYDITSYIRQHPGNL